MPEMSAADRIAALKTARAAAQAVMDELERQNRLGGGPDGAARRRPVLESARTFIEDADEMIDNLAASMVTVTIDAPKLDRVNTLAGELNAKITANALLNLGIESLTDVLNSASEVKEALG